MKLRMLSTVLLLVTLIGMSSSCSIQYGFSDGNTQKYDQKTLQVDFAQNNSALAPGTLTQSFTESLRDLFLSQSKMNLVESSGEVLLESTVVEYRVSPVAVTSQDQNTATNRLSIKIKVKCINTVDPDAEFEQTFSRFADFDSGTSLSSVED